MRAWRPKRHKESQAPAPILVPLFLFLLLPLGLPYVNWASQECCLFYLRSSLQSLDLPLFYFCRLFRSLSFQFSSVQLLSRVWLFATPWIAARQASLSITNSRSSLRLMSIKSVMPSSHLISCHPLPLLPSIPPASLTFSHRYFGLLFLILTT